MIRCASAARKSSLNKDVGFGTAPWVVNARFMSIAGRIGADSDA
jgi:hypothetical protein